MNAFAVVVFLTILLVVLLLSQRVRETFDDVSCDECLALFPDILNVPLDNISLTASESATLTEISERIQNYIQNTSKHIMKITDSIIDFINQRKQGKVCKLYIKSTDEYTKCLKKFVSSKSPLVDKIIRKASVCTPPSACDDIRLYPLDHEKAKCKDTSSCNSLDEFEQNILNETMKIRELISKCDTNNPCVTPYSKVLLIKLRSQMSKHVKDVESARGGQLGNAHGMDDMSFDTNSWVVSSSIS